MSTTPSQQWLESTDIPLFSGTVYMHLQYSTHFNPLLLSATHQPLLFLYPLPLLSPPLYTNQRENNIVPYINGLIWTLNFEFLANLCVHSWQALSITLCWLSTTDCAFTLLVHVWPLTFACGLERTLLHWWRRHSVWWCPQTSWCGQGLLSLPLCHPPLSMSMAAAFRLHSLRDHSSALVRQALPMLKVLECEETADTAWSVVGVVISCHSLQFSG